MNKIYEKKKIDMGLVSAALNNTNITGKYFPMAGYRSVLAILSGGAMADTKTTILQLMQAKNAAALDAKVITVGTCTITAGVLATELTLVLTTTLNTHTVVINGLTFTAHTDTTTVALRQFKIDGDDTADAVALCVCINDPTYGVPGVTASNNTNTVTLISTVPGETVITAVAGQATIVRATTKAQAYVEIDPMIMDGAGGFTHLACKVTTTANSNVAVVLIRGKHVKAISQKVGGSYPA